jgi:SPP1 gp7 family putative phage head morphogenesis protein
MPTSTLDDVIAAFQRSILRNERRAASEMVRVYVEGWKRVRSQLDRLQGEYDRTIALGEKPSLGWIYQNSRLADMQELIGNELSKFSNYAVGRITEEQRRVIEMSLEFSRDEMILRLGPEYDVSDIRRIRSLPIDEVIVMVGSNQQGSPLKALFDSISIEGSQRASDALVEGMMLGYNPRKIAPMIRDALGVQLNRALTISRTETMRAQRIATEQNYNANSDIVKGWRWVAEVTGACPSCLAMHGREFPLTEKMSTHPNCRCAQSPITMSWEEIGAQYGIDFSGIDNVGPSFDELAKKYNMSEKQIARYQTNKMTGEQFFKTLSAEEQRNILGPAKWMAWNDGLFEFDQLSRKTYSVIWGEGRRVASLKDLLGEEEARRYLEEIRNRKE